MRARLGEHLVECGSLTTTQLEAALAAQRRGEERFGECVRRLGLVSDEDVLRALAAQLDLSFLNIDGVKPTSEVARALPMEYVRRAGVLPLDIERGVLRYATADPGNRRIYEDVRLLSGFEAAEVVALSTSIEQKIDEHYQLTVERMVADLRGGQDADVVPDNLHDIEVMASEPTIINLVNLIISSAVKERASDVHLVPFEGRIELRYRIDGVLQEIPPPPRHLHAALVSRIKIMAEMNIAERYLPQDGRIQITHAGHRVDIRVGTMPTMGGESVVMRLLEKGSRIQSMQELGFDAERDATLERVVEKPHGIFLATGPTGSGKTTSLYSIIHRIYSIEKKILTIEDPVEYELPGVAQIPVRPARGFTFATGLRSILRQDPDVVMVGEIRDVETAEIAIRAALTGHLVFSTLHTNDSAGAVTRLMDMGIEPFLIASSLEGVLAQRLVRKICEKCRTQVPLSDDLRTKLTLHGIEDLGEHTFRGTGCDACRRTGYRGRMGLFELLIFTPTLRQAVLEKSPGPAIKELARQGMLTIRDDGLRRAAAGFTTLDEVLRVALDQSG
ncbi:MAG: GspE/PulE family protein [Planctomycetota bacterium]